jgi:outer membrane receptor for ferrienterochelin and colicins
MTGKRLLLLFLSLFLLNLSVFSQEKNVKGKVTDPADKAVSGAIVVLINQSTGLERTANTDGDGIFIFNGLGSESYKAVITARGFARMEKTVDSGQGELVFKLEIAPLREDVTVVSGSRQEELRERLNTKVDVVTENDIKTTGYETVGEVLREVPGVITRRGSDTSGVAGEQVQGVNSRQVLVLMDGQPLIGARGIKSGNLNLDRQSTGRLSAVEVVKGASSALYGSDAIGGVINLITREPNRPFTATFTASGGNFGILDTRGDIAFKHKKLSGIFSLERHKNNGFDLDPATFSQEGAGFHRYDTYGKLKYQFNDKFSLTGFANSYWNTSVGRVNGESGPQFNNVDDESQNYGLTGDWAIDDRTALQMRGYFARFDEITTGSLFPSGTALPDGDLFERYGKLDATLSRVIGERQFFQAGVEWTTDRYRGINRLQNDSGVKADTSVLWLQDKISATSRLTFTVGGRYDHHSVFGSAFSPKIGLNYRLTNYASLRASWGRGFRAPDLGQLFYHFDNSPNFYQVLGNPGLSPEHSGSWQAGGEFNGFTRKLHIGVNYFRNDVRNLIDSTSLGFVTSAANVRALLTANGLDPALGQYITHYNVLLFVYQNRANVYTQGAELDGSYALPLGFQVSGAYTYLDARDNSDTISKGRYLTGRNRHQGFVKLAYDNIRYKFNANLRGSFYSKWIASRNETTNVETIAAPFQLWDLYGAKSLPKGFEVFAAMDNMFDSKDPNSGTNQAIFRPEAGRTFRLGVRWSLDREK